MQIRILPDTSTSTGASLSTSSPRTARLLPRWGFSSHIHPHPHSLQCLQCSKLTPIQIIQGKVWIFLLLLSSLTSKQPSDVTCRSCFAPMQIVVQSFVVADSKGQGELVASMCILLALFELTLPNQQSIERASSKSPVSCLAPLCLTMAPAATTRSRFAGSGLFEVDAQSYCLRY